MTAKQLTTIEVPTRDIETVNPYDRMVELTLGSDAGVDKLEKILELKERHERNEARKAYHKAMAEFKKNPPTIEKDKFVGYENRDGSTTGYKHATLGNVSEKINTALSENGLNATWKTEQFEDGNIKVTCIITHELGHSESTYLMSKPDASGKKNPIQAISSAVTYLERYTILAITGIATVDQDDDGQRACAPQRSMAWNSKEGKDLDKLKEIRPDVYNAMVSTHGNVEPNNLDEIKIGLAWCNQKIDNENKE